RHWSVFLIVRLGFNDDFVTPRIRSSLGSAFDWVAYGFDGVAKQISPKGLERLVLELQHHSPAPGVVGHQGHGSSAAVALLHQQRRAPLILGRPGLENHGCAGLWLRKHLWKANSRHVIPGLQVFLWLVLQSSGRVVAATLSRRRLEGLTVDWPRCRAGQINWQEIRQRGVGVAARRERLAPAQHQKRAASAEDKLLDCLQLVKGEERSFDTAQNYCVIFEELLLRLWKTRSKLVCILDSLPVVLAVRRPQHRHQRKVLLLRNGFPKLAVLPPRLTFKIENPRLRVGDVDQKFLAVV